MSNTLLRQWAMLKRVPRYPAKINTRSLAELLDKEGFSVSQRTVQRDLKTLSGLFPDLQSDGNRDVAGWSWKRESTVNDIPAIDPPMALTFKLAQDFLSQIIPPAVLELIQPYFDCSEQVLATLEKPGLTDWADKVRILPRTQPLIPAKIKPEVVDVVYEALLEGRQFRGRYRNRDGDVAEYEFHPLGLVFRESVAYLVATVWDYEDLRHYAMHRFLSCELLEELSRVPVNFSLDGYVSTGTFEYVHVEGKMIRLKAIFEKDAAYHLQETPLSKDQTITPRPDGRVEVTATVKDSEQLRWWLLGFGGFAEIVEPVKLRKELQALSGKLGLMYL